MGLNLDQFVALEQFEMIRKETALRIKGIKSVFELDILRPNNEHRTIIVNAVPLFDKEKVFKGTYGVFRDITKRKQVEKALSHEQYLLHILLKNVPEDLEVYTDKNMLGAMIRNLVSNAVKFTTKGGNIAISAKTVADNFIEISITDNCIGMNKDIIDHLFILDVNTNRNGTEGECSTGLGLILCKDFIEKHGGKLWVMSKEGKGSTFRFTLQGK